MNSGNRTGSEHLPGAALSHEIAAGEHVEMEIDQFISRSHDQRVKAEGERTVEEAWRESERREEVRRREENRDGWLSWYRHLESGYLERAAECGRRASLIEDRGRVSADGRMPR